VRQVQSRLRSLHAAVWVLHFFQEIAMSKPFELPEELTIYGVVETRDAMLAWVTEQTAKSAKLLEVSAARVREVDGSGLQLVAALANMEQPWQLVAASEPFRDACNTLGLSSWLDNTHVHS